MFSSKGNRQLLPGLLLILLMSLVWVACTTPLPSGDGNSLCRSTNECPQGYVCYMSLCHWKEALPAHVLQSREVSVPEPAQEPSSDKAEPGDGKGDASVEIPEEITQEIRPPEGNCKEGQPDCKRCGSRDDCPTGLLCRDARCVPCQKDEDCGASVERCVEGRCVRNGCASNADCLGGQVCFQSRCQPCKDDQQCSSGQLCLKGLCLEAQCRSNKDCSGGLVCSQSKCNPCQDSSDCDGGFVCVVGLCKPGDCVANQDCSGGKACIAQQCSACTASSQCIVGEVCANGACIKGECIVDPDCKGGQICIQNKCTSCTDNASCGTGKVCSSGVCSTGNCVTSSDCKGGQICITNQCSPCSNKSQCATGEVCDKGACKKGNCVTSSDCKGGQVCLQNTCSDCRSSQDCNTQLFQQCVAGRCSTPAILVNGSYRWADGTMAKDCASYRFPPRGYQPATTNGVYILQPSTGTAYAAFCAQEFVGGGWTLVMKADGSKGTFQYNSAQWNSTTPLNPTALKIDRTEAKFDSYSKVEVEDILLVAATGTSRARTLMARKKGTSLYELLKDGKFKTFDVPAGRLAWKSLFPGGSAQYFCNREGLNVQGSSGVNGTIPSVRIGLLGNNENDCTTPDSFLGVGAYPRSNVASTGNYSVYGSDAGDRNTRSFVYVYVRKLTSQLTLTTANGAFQRSDGKAEPSCLAYKMPPVASSKDGLYWIQPAGAAKPFVAWCDMKTRGGGWTLVLKADGRKNTFQYDQRIWTDGKPWNPQNAAFDSNEAKLQGFLNLPVQQLLLRLRTPAANGALREVVISKRAPSTQTLFSGGFQSFDYNLGRTVWKQLMGSSGSLQRYCNREGFNNIASRGHARSRLGIISNEGNNCNYTDSRIGLGTAGNSCGQNNNLSVGNNAKCSTDNRDRADASFGYLLVR